MGTQPITVLAVYVPAGGGSGDGGGSGATIDSFDETTGSLFNDTFVSVSPDPGGTLTKSGNVDGYVDTTSSAETITALSPTSPTGVDFSRWVALAPPTIAGAGAALAVQKGEVGSCACILSIAAPLDLRGDSTIRAADHRTLRSAFHGHPMAKRYGDAAHMRARASTHPDFCRELGEPIHASGENLPSAAANPAWCPSITAPNTASACSISAAKVMATRNEVRARLVSLDDRRYRPV